MGLGQSPRGGDDLVLRRGVGGSGLLQVLQVGQAALDGGVREAPGGEPGDGERVEVTDHEELRRRARNMANGSIS